MKTIDLSELRAAQDMVADHGLWVSIAEHRQTMAANQAHPVESELTRHGLIEIVKLSEA